jgi:hypothetical protein
MTAMPQPQENISARKKSRREIGGPAQRLQARVQKLTGGHHSHSTAHFFRATSAGECLVVSTVALCGANSKPNSLTPCRHVRPCSAPVVENYYVAHLACCLVLVLMQCGLVLLAPSS